MEVMGTFCIAEILLGLISICSHSGFHASLYLPSSSNNRSLLSILSQRQADGLKQAAAREREEQIKRKSFLRSRGVPFSYGEMIRGAMVDDDLVVVLFFLA